MSQLEMISQRRESSATSLLQRPDFFLSALVDAIYDEIAFITQDMEGRIVYLSRSAERVLNHNPAGLLDRHLADALTDNPCNEHFRSCVEGSRNGPLGRMCEIFDRDGQRLQLMYWRIQISNQAVPIGTCGILRRLNHINTDSDEMTPLEEKELMERVRLLSNVERQVIELVVSGHMNKKMASILDVAVRTIESRRSRAMIKLQARSLSELVQIWVNVRRIEAKMRAKQLSANSGREVACTKSAVNSPRIGASSSNAASELVHS